MVIHKKPLILFSLIIFIFIGCSYLKDSKPIFPIKEYERMIVGRLDADYVGTETCLSACHYHDKIKKDFDASTMGTQLSAESGIPIVNCESCHGPGSLAIEGMTKENTGNDALKSEQTACDYKSLIDIKNLPAQARSLICLKCHTANASFNLHDWNTGIHNINDISCSDCHNVHMGPDLIIRKDDMEGMCEKCHLDIKALFALPSHHPIHEKRIFCIDCHNPHGSTSEHLLNGFTVKETCTECHAEKEGPFIFEHADITEDCTTCHNPHGSVNNNLLTARVPFLCMQCHTSHRTDSSVTPESKSTFYTRCTDCHSQIHGTDLPSSDGSGKFTQ